MNVEYNSNREKTITFTVPKDCDGIDAKTFLRRHCELSARTLSKLKRTKLGITRNGELLKTTHILKAGDKVVINCSSYTTKMVRLEDGNFFEVLRSKLGSVER